MKLLLSPALWIAMAVVLFAVAALAALAIYRTWRIDDQDLRDERRTTPMPEDTQPTPCACGRCPDCERRETARLEALYSLPAAAREPRRLP